LTEGSSQLREGQNIGDGFGPKSPERRQSPGIQADSPDLELKKAEKAISSLLNMKMSGGGDKRKQMQALQMSLANLIQGNQIQHKDIETRHSKGNQNQYLDNETGRSMLSKESPRTQNPT
jgi:hypothetical protein